MTGLPIDRRIFVVGVPRSGTTLVQSLLAAHSRLTSFTESHLFARHFRLLPGTGAAILIRDPAARIDAFLVENGFDPREIVAADVGAPASRWLLPWRSRSVGRGLLRLLDEMARARGLANWIEKTPRHLRYAPFLERLSDRPVHFVHVIREGMQTVASLYAASRNWERPYDLDTSVRRWNDDVAFSIGRIGRPADHFVLYERLTSEPEATLGRLLAELGLDWEPEILERYAAGSERLVTAEESWKEGVGRPIRASGGSSTALTAEQRKRVADSLNPDLYPRFLALESS